MDADEILHPLTLEEFKSTFWKKQFCHARGNASRYVELFDWDVLNALLTTQRLLPPRFRLMHHGHQIDPYSFQLREPAFLVDSASLCGQLRRGATLIINDVDEIHPRLKETAIGMAQTFKAPANVSVYACWKDDKGFGIHYDVQEIFILQTRGKKHWRVWEPTSSTPLRSKIIGNEQPQSKLVWDDILESGSWLYIPPGWWHVALPIDGPCLHLNVSIIPYRGIDFLSWLERRLKQSLQAELYLPELQAPEEIEDYLHNLRIAIEKHLAIDVYHEFAEEMEKKRFAYPRINFPDI